MKVKYEIRFIWTDIDHGPYRFQYEVHLAYHAADDVQKTNS